MSRIGNNPVEVPEDVTVVIDGSHVKVTGPKGELERDFSPLINIEQDGNVVAFTRKNDSKQARIMHGTTRSLFANMVQGVHEGFEKKLELSGVGYRAQVQGNKLVLNVGYSHRVEVVAPEGISFETPSNTEITVKGIDKDTVGQVAANIREARKPEPYKGKGIHYVGEYIIRKEGKTGK